MLERFAVVADWALDGMGNQPVEHVAIVIKGDRIEDILPGSQLGDPPFRVLRFPGATVLPGLIDAHVHLTLSPLQASLVEYHKEKTDDDLLAQAVQNAHRGLLAGVTTVRDVGARNKTGLTIKEAVAKGAAPGPHILAAGMPITCTRGHMYYMGGEVANRDQIIGLIEKQAAEGVDVIKVVASGGGLTPGTGLMRSQFSRDDLKLVVEESHKWGLPVAAHAGWGPAIRDCAETGVDTIEHCTFVTPGGFHVDDDDLRVLRDTNPHIVTTKYQFFLERNDTEIVGALKDEIECSPAAMYEDTIRQLRQFHQAGLRITTGSDAGVIGINFEDVIGEVEMLVLSGYTPLEAVSAATHIAATALKLESDRGALKKGYRADLLLVRGAVHEGVDTLHNPLLVIKDGEIVLNVQAN